jgi:hypothetical protein
VDSGTEGHRCAGLTQVGGRITCGGGGAADPSPLPFPLLLAYSTTAAVADMSIPSSGNLPPESAPKVQSEEKELLKVDLRC